MRLLRQLTAVIMVCLLSRGALAAEITVAVAANFAGAMQEIVAAFETETAHTVRLSVGSSGKFAAQIQHGGPFHLFLSADQAKPAALEAAGLTVPGSRFTYAVGTLALWSSHADFVDGDFTRLRRGDFNKLAIANPKLAPYGAAAVEVLAALGLRKATEAKWVQGENVAQAYQFVATGNADLGLVALSQIMDKREGSSHIIPAELHRPIRQDAVLLANPADNAAEHTAAAALLAFLKSDAAGAIMHAYGYRAD